MIAFNVNDLASMLVTGEKIDKSVREEIVVRMVEAAVDVVNDPRKRDSILGTLNDIMEDSYQLVTPDLTMVEYIQHIQKEQKKHGWDERLQIKMTSKRLGPHFHRITIEMDLDATFRINGDRRKTPRARQPIAEVVSDNPGSDEINELLDAISLSQQPPKRRTPVLSDRYARTVNDPTGRGWGGNFKL